jgi:hypothetical protein
VRVLGHLVGMELADVIVGGGSLGGGASEVFDGMPASGTTGILASGVYVCPDSCAVSHFTEPLSILVQLSEPRWPGDSFAIAPCQIKVKYC